MQILLILSSSWEMRVANSQVTNTREGDPV